MIIFTIALNIMNKLLDPKIKKIKIDDTKLDYG